MQDLADFNTIKQNTKQYFKSFKDKEPIFHNKVMLKLCLAYLEEIIAYEAYPEYEIFIAKCSILFKIMGYYSRKPDYLQVSLALAQDYLISAGIEQATIDKVKNCILLETADNFSPAMQLFSDSISFYYGAENFSRFIKDLYKEESKFNRPEQISFLSWLNELNKKMKTHLFYSSYAKSHLLNQKIKNIAYIFLKISKKGLKHKQVLPAPTYKADSRNYKNLRGIDTMFKITSGNHQRLSAMADNKAHIMITVNSIILSAILSILLRKITEYEFLLLPAIIILFVSMMAMVFAILSTRPSLPKSNYSAQDIAEHKVNLLFFGNFYKMNLEEYALAMGKMMEDGDYLYSSLCKDIYMQGIVLGKKYKYLRRSYNIFMYGLIVSVFAFSLASLLYIY